MYSPQTLLATVLTLTLPLLAAGCSSEFPDHGHTRVHVRLTPATEVTAGYYTLVVSKQGVDQAVRVRTGKRNTTDVPAGRVTLSVAGLSVCPSVLQLTGRSVQLVDLSLMTSSARCSTTVGP
jgi:hypothetical protein